VLTVGSHSLDALNIEGSQARGNCWKRRGVLDS
jgi:hypothetical protein